MTQKLVRGAATYLSANILSAAIPFLLLPILTRILNPEEYGLVSIFEALIVCLGAFTGLNLHSAIGVQYYKKEASNFPQYVTASLAILVLSSALTAVVVQSLSPVLYQWTGVSAKWLLIAVGVSTAQSLINTRLVIWQASNKPLFYGLFQILQSTFNAGLSIYFVMGLQWGATGRILGIATAVILFSLLSLATLNQERILRRRWTQRYAIDALKFGIPLIPHTLGGIALTFADRFILKNQLGLEATGLYFVAMQLAMPLSMLGGSFNRAFTPWLYERLSHKQDETAVVASYFSMATFIVIGILYAGAVYVGSPFLLGARYQALKEVEVILIGGSICQAAYFSVVNYIFYSGKTAFLSAITLTTGMMYLLLGWHLTGQFGTMGLAWTYFFIQLCTFLAVWIVGAKINRKPWLNVPKLKPIASAWIGQLVNLNR